MHTIQEIMGKELTISVLFLSFAAAIPVAIRTRTSFMTFQELLTDHNSLEFLDLMSQIYKNRNSILSKKGGKRVYASYEMKETPFCFSKANG